MRHMLSQFLRVNQRAPVFGNDHCCSPRMGIVDGKHCKATCTVRGLFCFGADPPDFVAFESVDAVGVVDIWVCHNNRRAGVREERVKEKPARLSEPDALRTREWHCSITIADLQHG
jgi:hypothetical protein